MLENKFSNKFVKPWLTRQGIFHFKKPQGKFVTRKGIADYQLCVRGQYIALELKTDVGKLSESQVLERQRVLDAGGVFMVARPKTWQGIQKILEEMREGVVERPGLLKLLSE